jgi:hypothetical protein
VRSASRIPLPIGVVLVADGLPAPFVERLRAHFDPFSLGGSLLAPDLVLSPGKIVPEGEPVAAVEGLEVRRMRAGHLLFVAGELRVACDPAEGEAIVDLPSDEPEVFDRFATILADPLVVELARPLGWNAVHAAGVVSGNRGILLPGPGGSGKSTLFRQAKDRGLGLLSDDLVWIGEEEGRFRLVPFPRGAPFDPIAPPSVREAPLAAVVFPSIGSGAASRSVRLGAAEALSLLGEQARGVAGGATLASHFRLLVRIAAQMPAWRYEAPFGAGDAVGEIVGLLGSERTPAGARWVEGRPGGEMDSPLHRKDEERPAIHPRTRKPHR